MTVIHDWYWYPSYTEEDSAVLKGLDQAEVKVGEEQRYIGVWDQGVTNPKHGV